MREFRVGLDELLSKPDDELTHDQKEFIYYYRRRMPVSVNSGVMNRICRKFEEKFDGRLMLRVTGDTFDYSIMKYDTDYTRTQFCAIEGLCEQHRQVMREYMQTDYKKRGDAEDASIFRGIMMDTLKAGCHKVCTNGEQLCNLVIDICYARSGTKRFAWDICGEEIVQRLLERSEGVISFPVSDPDGDIYYAGERFKMVTKGV